MKRTLLIFLCTAVMAVLFIPAAHAQGFQSHYEWGISAGVLLYQGDLTPEKLGASKTMKFAMGLQACKILGPSFSIRAQLLRGSLKGDDSKYAHPDYRQQRNFKFSTPVTELSMQFVWNLRANNDADKGFAPYLFAGGGLSFLKIKRNWSGINPTFFNVESSSAVWTGLAADTLQNLPRVIPVIPVGAGIKYFLNPHWALNIESSYRFSNTDYLDGFSKSVNPNKNDHYVNYQVGIAYRQGKTDRLKCPRVKY